MKRRGRRIAVAFGATVAILGPLSWFWHSSLLPGTYSVVEMGYADPGGGAGHDHHAGSVQRSVTTLTADPDRRPDVSVTLTARAQRLRLASGRTVDGYTLNGRSPGPVIRATLGDLVQVRLVNASVPDGVSVHWHGVDVPNAEDGVAGVTQNAVGVGQQYTYRFVVDRAGTFWYHSHQQSHDQVPGGLLGALIVSPKHPGRAVDVVALSHLYGGVRTINGREGDVRATVPPGRTARVRVINTDAGELSAWVVGAPFRLAAIDGTDVHKPTPVRGRTVSVAAGGRADLAVTMPRDGTPVRVELGGDASVVLGSASFHPPHASRPTATLDPLTYGTPAPLDFNPAAPDRRFTYDVGRRPGFLDGRPGLWWTINGHTYPDTPMFMVAEGDVVVMHLHNHSGQVHPMHLHGHHAVVLRHNGRAATGSPWWIDSLTVANNDSYDIAFVADNPGIWVDHCHNLPHAAQGLLAHLMYEGVSTPFRIGGPHHNHPE